MKRSLCGSLILLAFGCTQHQAATDGGPLGQKPVTLITADPGEIFGALSMTTAGNETELFYVQQASGTYEFLLQHLSLGGDEIGSAVQVAQSEAPTPPNTSVGSDGTEVTCCWEDYGLDPDPGHAHVRGPLIECNSVPVGGTATDHAMDGGFADIGTGPIVASNAGVTIVGYAHTGVPGLTQEVLYFSWGDSFPFESPYTLAAWQIVPASNGEDSYFEVVLSDGGQLGYGTEQLNLYNDGGLQEIGGGASQGQFAAAGKDELIGIAMHQGTSVAETVIGGSASSVESLSGESEQPLAPLAAAACGADSFGFAYANGDGTVQFRQTNSLGIPAGDSSLTVGTLDRAAIGLALVPADGGVLLAAGTSDEIAIYWVPCP